jgi:integrase
LAAVTDPKELGRVLNAIYEYKGSFIVRCALRLAPLFFVRPGELRNAKWADFDFANAEWRFIASKTKTPHIVPLAAQSLAILTELKPHTRNSEYVFPNPRSIKRPLSDNAVLAALRRMGIDKTEMSGHGFRATARTILDEVLGFRPDFIEHQLAHAVRDPNGRAYNRTAHLAERKKMMQAWADYLDQLRQPVKQRAESHSHDLRSTRPPRRKHGHRPSASRWEISKDLFADTTVPNQSLDDEQAAPIETAQ